MKYSKDKRVVFNPENHTYYHKDKQLTSVTSFISRFKNKFDSDYHSKRIAERDGVTQAEILALWKEKANKSCDIGTAIHKIFEDYTLGNYANVGGALQFDLCHVKDDYELDFRAKSQVAYKFINDFFITKRLIPEYSEYIVYNDFLAGQVDLICKDVKGNRYILDFKTNNSIDHNSYDKKMKGVFEAHNDCNFNHYSLQLSIYKRMFNEPIKGTFIIHISESGYQFMKCPDLLQGMELGDLK